MSTGLQRAHNNLFIEAVSNSFNDFVKTNYLSAVNGTPGAGQFQSGIKNRAPCVDMSQDLSTVMGINRIAVQQITEVQGEYGASGETVFKAVGDKFEQFRFVGGWSASSTSNGSYVTPSLVTSDYAEIVFYGTGLNLLMFAAGSYDLRVSIDGGTEGANILTSYSNVITARNYATNQVIPIASGLSLGIHTIKIRQNSVSTNPAIYGFEILNESSSVKVQPGTLYASGLKTTLAQQASFAYNTGVTGTRGGRIVTYLKVDGTVGQAFQAVDAAPAYLASADHTNEEVARTYHWREFGVGRADDFSTLTGSTSDRAFTLDDGTTTFVGNDVSVYSGYGVDPVGLVGAGSFITFTFVGTGLDYTHGNGSLTPGYIIDISIDGAVIGSGLTGTQLTGGGSDRTIKIASGLPYGTHTVKFLTTSIGGGTGFAVRRFTVYGPKKPSLPADAVELADYNVMASLVGNSTGSNDAISTGVIRKQAAQREFTYVGAGWYMNSMTPILIGGWNAGTSTNGDYYQYTFFGTGFEVRNNNDDGWATISLNGVVVSTANYSISLNGAAYSGTPTAGTIQINTYGGLTYDVATGTLKGTAVGGGLRVTGLALNTYTMKSLKIAGGTGAMYSAAFDIITPIHSHKEAKPAFNGASLIGSQGISDKRNFSPLSMPLGQEKQLHVCQSYDTSASTTSTLYVPIPQMRATVILKKPARVRCSWTIGAALSGANAFAYTRVFINGAGSGVQSASQAFGSNNMTNLVGSHEVELPAGSHYVQLCWKTSGTVSHLGFGDDVPVRSFIVEEV